MAPAFEASIIGSAEVHAHFHQLIEASGPETLRLACSVGALPIANAWKEKAAWETGTYRRSIHIGGVTQPEGGSDRDVQREPVPQPEMSTEQVMVYIGTDIVDPPYPWFLEEGTATMDARPAAQPAFDENKEKAEQEIAAVLRQKLGSS
ncbi:MAG: hypothetical protein M3O87_08220 [Candidatus Dormibacteraeota bacterium]|nr:hypothetical protein [Candidatus Dormibacteraeota bacterium]